MNESAVRCFVAASLVVAALAFSDCQAHAQGRDALLNGAVIGAAVGAGIGVGFTHAVRDSELGFSQYAQGALIFGGIGAGVGVGVDALLCRASGLPRTRPPRLFVAPAVWRDLAGIVVKWRW